MRRKDGPCRDTGRGDRGRQGGLGELRGRSRLIEAQLAAWRRSGKISELLATVPGVGIKGATAVAVALANRTARIVWAVMARGEGCRAKLTATEIVGQTA